jgi:hypothetical protein
MRKHKRRAPAEASAPHESFGSKLYQFTLAGPSLTVEYGLAYPFRSEALFTDGEQGEFVRVRVKNVGRGMAKRCKCYVRHISLDSSGRVTRLPSEELMLTSWVPREANTTIMNIPGGWGFLADVAYTRKLHGTFRVMPVFAAQNRNVLDIFDHVGDFELEFVVLGENVTAAKRSIKFRFEGGSRALLPLD